LINIEDGARTGQDPPCHIPSPAHSRTLRTAPGTAGLQVTTFAGPSLIVEIHGEIDIFSAPGLRDELLRVIRRYGPQGWKTVRST
jgi:hypothetical protein